METRLPCHVPRLHGLLLERAHSGHRTEITCRCTVTPCMRVLLYRFYFSEFQQRPKILDLLPKPSNTRVGGQSRDPICSLPRYFRALVRSMMFCWAGSNLGCSGIPTSKVFETVRSWWIWTRLTKLVDQFAQSALSVSDIRVL